MNDKLSPNGGEISKVAAYYSDNFFLRPVIQSIPLVGGAIDTLFAGLGSTWQNKRFEHFIKTLSTRLKTVENYQNLPPVEPGEPLFDFIIQVVQEVIKTRSEEKRNRFANLVANQVIEPHEWDEAETACRLIGELSDQHIKMLKIALRAPFCDGVFNGHRAIMYKEPSKSTKRKIPPTNIRGEFPEISDAAVAMLASELVAKGLLAELRFVFWNKEDDALRQPQIYEPTNIAKWLLDFISNPH